MALLKIITHPNEILRTKCKQVKEITDELKKFADDMIETMYTYGGVGLAANQVADLRAIIIIDNSFIDDDNYIKINDEITKYPVMTFVNPEIVERGKGVVRLEEGCLSVPERLENVKRRTEIKMKALSEDGEIEIIAKGVPAIIIQHEIDHLDGILFIDRRIK